ncbi:MAG: AbgT family transporter [Hyphomicrobiales bacterium]
MVGFSQKYVKDAGIGTIVALMLPYTMVLLVVWTLMLIVWNFLGNPAGTAEPTASARGHAPPTPEGRRPPRATARLQFAKSTAPDGQAAAAIPRAAPPSSFISADSARAKKKKKKKARQRPHEGAVLKR